MNFRNNQNDKSYKMKKPMKKPMKMSPDYYTEERIKIFYMSGEKVKESIIYSTMHPRYSENYFNCSKYKNMTFQEYIDSQTYTVKIELNSNDFNEIEEYTIKDFENDDEVYDKSKLLLILRYYICDEYN